MPFLRDLSLKRNQRLNQLRSRVNQSRKTNEGETSDFVSSDVLNEPVNDTVAQTAQASKSSNIFEQKTIEERKQKESHKPIIIVQKNEHELRIDKVCETSDLKAKLAPSMEMLEKKTNEKIKGIIRKKILQEPDRDNNNSS
ncbi:Ntc20p [Saccharomyces paradoxus]|uniref:Ntc20p n=1 Tax=Saccharomyces paradoxus TaxID=27291 RepID=A0A8B8UMA9_SACPA|nr:Ntc20 [Saccharomyces paradoxus]QHS71749.1 Ntc20 [Saccharomyces paradoxus]